MLVKKRQETNSWFKDADFPDNEEENWYLMNDQFSYTVDNEASTSMSATSAMEVDGEAARQFVGEGGIMGAASMQVLGTLAWALS